MSPPSSPLMKWSSNIISAAIAAISAIDHARGSWRTSYPASRSAVANTSLISESSSMKSTFFMVGGPAHVPLC
ncbi:MAG: hypothetical protein M3O71_14225 [Bacteroidota bacterium]|nr:hypothetical protein [Bacteroidota bacterium]